MKDCKTTKIDFSRKRFAQMADNFYNEGNYLSALRFAYKELDLYGGDGDVYVRLSDIYEGMNLHGVSINWWFRFLDMAEEEDFPDIYEGLAVNYLNIGNENQSAYYYNKLIDADDTLPEETKFDIAEAFSTTKKNNFRFVYPPELADYSKELHVGSMALKNGDCNRAVEELSKIEKGSKEYVSAQEMQAVASLLMGEVDRAEFICKELLKEYPNDIRTQATLAAVYLEQEKNAESRELALSLSQLDDLDTDDLYKVATVCCENDLHEEAYQKFCILDKKMPYDGRMLYFKGVSAYKSGHIQEAEEAFSTLCTVYPDAEVAKYYLNALREYLAAPESEPPKLIYFYHLPQEERESRCRTLIHMGSCPKDEAMLFGALALHDGYFRWCFDEMDGNDHDLQYLGLVTAAHVHADDFLRDILLDYEVLDVLKVETLRMLLERNEEMSLGIVLYNIYRKITLEKIKIGRKKRKRFIQAYAKVASKFVILHETYGRRVKKAAEKLYRALEKYEALDLIDSVDDCACAIFLNAGLKELGSDTTAIARAFDANVTKVSVLLTMLLSDEMGLDKNGELKTGEGQDETD